MKRADSHNLMLYTYESGSSSSPAIVFLHGGGLSGRQWQPQLDRLSDFYCLAPDLPEQGKSIEVKPFTLDDSAQQIAQLIRDRVPSKKAHIVGLSLGGAVALTLMRLYPEVVDHVIVSGTAAKLGSFLGAITMASAGMYRLMSAETLVNLSYKQFGIPPEYQQMFHDDLILTSTPEFVRTTVKALMAMEVPTQTHSPVLVAVGEKETIPAKQAARTLVKTIPGARGVLIPGVGHVWNLQAPDLFSEMVRCWITDQSQPPPLGPLTH
jgi:pimeloyl-ACP methyl ester carboxylesterase